MLEYQRPECYLGRKFSFIETLQSEFSSNILKPLLIGKTSGSQFQVIDGNALASLAHAVSLSTVKEIMIVGHTDCGGVHACYDAAQGRPPPLHWALWNWLHALTVVAKANSELTPYQLTELNVRVQVANVKAILGTLTVRPLKLGGYVYVLDDQGGGRLVEVK